MKPRPSFLMEYSFVNATAASSPWYANWQLRGLFRKSIAKNYALGCMARSVVTWDRTISKIEGS